MPETRLNVKTKINKPKISANKRLKCKNKNSSDSNSIELSSAMKKLCKIKKLTKKDLLIRRSQFLEVLNKANNDFEQEKNRSLLENGTSAIKLDQKLTKESMSLYHKPTKVRFDNKVYFETLNDTFKNSEAMDIEYPIANINNLKNNLRNANIKLTNSIDQISSQIIYNSLNLPIKSILKK